MIPHSKPLLLLLCALFLLTPANSGSCMANCTKPLFNTFCRITEDVCAYPTGDLEAYRAIRTLAVWSGKNSGNCVTKFRRFICGMYFPKCRFRTTIPMCWKDCYDAFSSCAESNGNAVARARCSAFVPTGQVATETCVNGVDTLDNTPCSCFSSGWKLSPIPFLALLPLVLLLSQFNS